MTKSIIEILIDYSGSMGYMEGTEHENKFLIDGKTRFYLAEQMIQKHIFPTIDYVEKIAIRLFRGATNKIEINTIYEGEFNFGKLCSFISKIDNPPPGGTPISAALNEAKQNLTKYSNYDRKILLITDGAESKGSSYISEAQSIAKLPGTPCKIYVIGLDQNEEMERKAKSIATGGYFNIKSQYFENKILQDFLVTLKLSLLQDSKEILQQSDDRLTKENIQIIDTKIAKTITENDASTTELIDNIQTQIDKTKAILSELEVIKEQLRIKQLLSSGVDSTTLTIDDDYSEDIKIKSETILYEHLCKQYGKDSVIWLNHHQESYLHHDFEIHDDFGDIVKIIECKGTPKCKPTFYMTANEWNYFLLHQQEYQLYRIFELDTTPQIYCIENLLNAILERKVVPYLTRPEILKENRVYLTILKFKFG